MDSNYLTPPPSFESLWSQKLVPDDKRLTRIRQFYLYQITHFLVKGKMAQWYQATLSLSAGC